MEQDQFLGVSPLFKNTNVLARARSQGVVLSFDESEKDALRVGMRGSVVSVLSFLYHEQILVEQFRWKMDLLEDYLHHLIEYTVRLVDRFPSLVFHKYFVACKRMFHDYYGDSVDWDSVLPRGLEELRPGNADSHVARELMKEMSIMGNKETERTVLMWVFNQNTRKANKFMRDRFDGWDTLHIPRPRVEATVNEYFP